MKIKALVTMLVLGSSSLALADTYSVAPTVRDHRQPAPAAESHYQYGLGRWRQPIVRPVLLADNTRVSGFAKIDVAASARAFTKLELKANNGHTDLDRVMIVFGNGQRQVVSLRGKIDGKLNASKSLTIDLEGGSRNIKSVLLMGTSGRRASIDVLAV